MLATRGAEFNARVRDYRREVWGDNAQYIQYGILGQRNADITVRERRCLSDLIREDPLIAKSVAAVTKELQHKHLGAVRRIQQDICKLSPQLKLFNNENNETNCLEKKIDYDVTAESIFFDKLKFNF